MNTIFSKIDSVGSPHIVREQIQEEIREAICRNRLKSGQKIVENDIAQAFGVSRTPVREAIHLLEYEGFVKSRPNKGAVVATLDVVTAIKFLDIQEMLEGLAAKLACQKITRTESSELFTNLQEIESAYLTGDLATAVECYDNWRLKIVKHSGNEYLLKQLVLSYAYLSRFKNFMEYNLSNAFFITELQDILHSFRLGDPMLSENAARNHVRKERERFITFHNTAGM